jgi:hypothetical protein
MIGNMPAVKVQKDKKTSINQESANVDPIVNEIVDRHHITRMEIDQLKTEVNDRYQIIRKTADEDISRINQAVESATEWQVLNRQMYWIHAQANETGTLDLMKKYVELSRDPSN